MRVPGYGSLFDIVCAAAELGFSPAALGVDLWAGVDPAAEALPWVAQSTIEGLWDTLLQASGDDAVALRLGEHPLARLNLIVALMYCGGAPRMALARMVERWPMLYPESGWHLISATHRLELRFESRLGAPHAALDAQYRLTWLVELLRRITGGRANPTLVSFAFPEPAHLVEFYRVFRCPVAFGQAAHTLRYDEIDAARVSVCADPWLMQALANAVDIPEPGSRSEMELPERLARALRTGLLGGDAGIKAIAPQLQLSVGQLRTRLRREGLTFRELTERVRKQVCLELVQRDDLTIDEVAVRLGYANTANFYRACQRWFGMTPRALRNRAERPAAD